MRIAIIDNYDSFTYNLVHIVEQYCEKVFVMRNDEIDWEKINKSDKIIFSPGPGLPDEVFAMKKIMDRYAKQKPILGVCLGMQFIGEYFGAQLINLKDIIHGIPKNTRILAIDDPLFKTIPQTFLSGRYHSWALSAIHFPDCLQITAVDETEIIMAIRHKHLDLCGVQFHPESIMTPYGNKILQNWILE
ncbi:anthranilate synthase component II [Ancylomarina longa]|uniref:Aminodeoxychorismate/anthranilate synthase component II n=1 Tax=Ancylomarina longa TaxID=2487017 RepID=A0A434AZS4_9BACT|nr:aminodeoxychorismate/anthranilate synthase component II [Ancylomarina longa]RUT80005.1 aminodeoxychorismate/anthranilate synthase component II [Ancylomarina longa]